jgi:elongation factor G
MGNFPRGRPRGLRVAERRWSSWDAVSGVQVSTEKSGRAAERARLPRLIVCSRLDRERASLDRTLESMRTSLGRELRAGADADRREKDFKGVVDLVAMKAYTFADDESGR